MLLLLLDTSHTNQLSTAQRGPGGGVRGEGGGNPSLHFYTLLRRKNTRYLAYRVLQSIPIYVPTYSTLE